MTIESHTEHPGHTMACVAHVGDEQLIVTEKVGGSIPLARPTANPTYGAMVYQVSTASCQGAEAGSIPASPADLLINDTSGAALPPPVRQPILSECAINSRYHPAVVRVSAELFA